MAYFVDKPADDAFQPADQLLKAIRADPGLRESLRRRLGIKPVDHAAMDRKIRDLRAKLAQLEAITAVPPRVPTPPPYLYKTTASNGHNSQPRRTR